MKRFGLFLDLVVSNSCRLLVVTAASSLAIGCALLLEFFSSHGLTHTPLLSAMIAFGGFGLLLAGIFHARQTTAGLQAGFRSLLAICPNPVLIANQNGFIEFANDAANELLMPRTGSLVGDPVAAFLPDLDRVLRSGEARRFRNSMRCDGRCDLEGSFTAEIRFFEYQDGAAQRFAAVITEVTKAWKIECASVAPQARAQTFSDRETDVMRLLLEGLANKEIAARLNVSEATVKSTLQQLFAAWGVRTRAQLVRAVLERQFSSLSPVSAEPKGCQRNPAREKHRESAVPESEFTSSTCLQIGKYVA